MASKSFKDSNMKVEPVIAQGVVTYARRRYRTGEEIVAVNHKERKQLLDTALAVEPNSAVGKKLKDKHAEWLKTHPNSEDDAKKKTAEEEQRKRAEEERKKAADARMSQSAGNARRGGQTNRQQQNQQPPAAPTTQTVTTQPPSQQGTQHQASQAPGNVPPIMRPAVGGLPPVISDNSGVTLNTDAKKE